MKARPPREDEAFIDPDRGVHGAAGGVVRCGGYFSSELGPGAGEAPHRARSSHTDATHDVVVFCCSTAAAAAATFFSVAPPAVVAINHRRGGHHRVPARHPCAAR